MKRKHGPQQKRDEHRFAEAASLLLNTEWELVPRDDESQGGPDFIVREKGRSFGLEVQEVFKGVASAKRGAALKRNQSENQLRIDRIRQQFENIAGNIPLYVKFLNEPDDSRTDHIVNELYKMKLGGKDFPYQNDFTIEQEDGLLTIFVSRLPDDWERDRLYRRDWLIVADTGGFVEKNREKIFRAVREKSEKVDRYRENVARENSVLRIR